MKGPLRTALRLALAALLFFWVLDIWNVDLPIGEEVVRTLIEILIVVLICYVAWGLINAAIQRRMHKEIPENEADDEQEEGGAGGANSCWWSSSSWPAWLFYRPWGCTSGP